MFCTNLLANMNVSAMIFNGAIMIEVVNIGMFTCVCRDTQQIYEINGRLPVGFTFQYVVAHRPVRATKMLLSVNG